MLTSRSPSNQRASSDSSSNFNEKSILDISPSPTPSSSSASLPILSRFKKRSPILNLLTVVGLFIILSVAYISTLRLNGADASECRSIYMYPSYARVVGFDSSHTKFASKYNLYLYREQGKDPFPYDDSDNEEGNTEQDIDHKNRKLIKSLNGIPVLFIPGNAGSYKQVRSFAAEAANIYYENNKHSTSNDINKRLDFYSAHFNEDFTAFHGRTMLDQAEYMNDAIKFILSLYQDQKTPPTSVILIGHSMGGVVARVILTLPNYQEDSVNTIISLSAPHAAAPATFDGDIMRTYAAVDRFWRTGFNNKNSIAYRRLHNVALISITGGMPDTILPADYTTLRGLVPDTNGFTMYTTGIPSVWTTIDHLAIVWCDQLRKVLASTLYQILDPSSSTKTKPLDERMKVFRRNLLSGFETDAVLDYSASTNDTTLRLKLKKEQIQNIKSSTLTMKSSTSSESNNFNLFTISNTKSPKLSFLSSIKPEQFNPDSKSSSILLCKDYKSFSGGQKSFVDLGNDQSGAIIDFECVDIFQDAYKVPNTVSYDTTLQDSSFGGSLDPFYAIQIPASVLANYSYVIYHDAVYKSESDFTKLSLHSENSTTFDINASVLELFWGTTYKISSKFTSSLLSLDLTVHNAWSSLLSYTLFVKYDGLGEPFNPFIRQYINDPFETKWHLQLNEVKHVSFHGIAPFTPFQNRTNPLHLELWNPSPVNVEISLKVDILRSLRLLILRYRLAVASFPIFIILATLWLQFRRFNSSGIFPSFKEGLSHLSGYAAPISVTLCFLSLISSNYMIQRVFYFLDPIGTTNPSELKSYHSNTYFLGLEEKFLCVMGPLFFVISLSFVHIIHLVILLLLKLAISPTVSLFTLFKLPTIGICTPVMNQIKNFNSTFHETRRFTGSIILSIFVMFYIPYQFAYMVCCLTQIIIVIRSYFGADSTLTCEVRKDNKKSLRSQNEVSYHLSMLMLMIWLIPVNLPVLIVFFHNIAVRWETPFSSHHNILAILPIILLIGRHVQGFTPLSQLQSQNVMTRRITSFILFYFGAFSLIYGIRHLYWLHYLFNSLCAWFFILSFWKA